MGLINIFNNIRNLTSLYFTEIEKMKIALIISLICLSAITAEANKRVKRQYPGMGMPMPVGGVVGAFGMGGGIGGQMGLGGIQNGFTGVHSGRYGGLIGSPIFGPGGIGPFNQPNNRQSRIDQLVNQVRIANDKLPFRVDNYNRDFKLISINYVLK